MGKPSIQMAAVETPNVNFIRAIAIVLVTVVHAAAEPPIFFQSPLSQDIGSWWTANIYDSIARSSIPLFIMISGALLLRPSKTSEPLKVFFKKRMSKIALPFFFWAAVYFTWFNFTNYLHQPLTTTLVIQELLTSPYYHFWYLYMLVGLYLLTPILRVVVTYADMKTLDYFIAMLIVGSAIVPLTSLFGPYSLNNIVFTLTGYVGYFLLGYRLQSVHPRRFVLWLSLVSGIAATAFGTYAISCHEGVFDSFFYNYLSAPVFLASTAMYLLLSNFHATQPQSLSPKVNWILRQIGQNTLPVYMFEAMILDSLQRGYFGFTISITNLNPIIEIPLITTVTLAICISVILPLKKIPYLSKVIG